MLPTCEKRNLVEQGDAVAYRDGQLMHLRCVRRCERGEAAPYCTDCARYHEGECE